MHKVLGVDSEELALRNFSAITIKVGVETRCPTLAIGAPTNASSLLW